MIGLNVYTYLCLLGFFHATDMAFTIGLIRKCEGVYENPEESEINFHKYFFKKFGLIKGSRISMSISIPLIMIIGSFAFFFSDFIAGFVLAMIFMVAYLNFVFYITYDDIGKKLKRKKNV